MTVEPRAAAVVYQARLHARFRWVGPGGEAALLALTEAGDTLNDYGDLGAAASSRRCPAELRVEGPAGT